MSATAVVDWKEGWMEGGLRLRLDLLCYVFRVNRSRSRGREFK